MTKAQDARWMAAALALADRGRGRTAPNPNVGCVVVRDDRVIGRGWTQNGGRPHAEAVALAQAGDRAAGATLYVTLEPCAHVSERGPACTDLVVGAKPARVVVALTDPDPRTAGKGIERLREADIQVTEGMLADQARASMAGFFTRRERGRPFVTLKLAISIDGRIAMIDGRSRWITGDAARAHTHLERSRHETILVGRGTVDADAPRLDVRLSGLEERSPLRAVLTSGPAPEGWLAVPKPELISSLPGDHLFIEGGARTAAAFLAADLVDRLLIYSAPIVIGSGLDPVADIGLDDLADAHGRWALADQRRLGSDRMDIYERRRD